MDARGVSLQLPISAGLDYPRYWIDWLLKGTAPPKSVRYNAGITCRRLVGELTPPSPGPNG